MFSIVRVNICLNPVLSKQHFREVSEGEKPESKGIWWIETGEEVWRDGALPGCKKSISDIVQIVLLREKGFVLFSSLATHWEQLA